MTVLQSNDGCMSKEFASAAMHVGKLRTEQQDALDIGDDFAVLADGMGGHPNGAEAARVAVASLSGALSLGGSESEKLLSGFQLAQERVANLSRTRTPWTSPATTLIAAVRTADGFLVGHVGDSRVYSWVDGDLKQITTDHEGFDGRITRWVGYGAGHAPDLIKVLKTDTLLICSDGLFLELTDETIAESLTDSRTQGYPSVTAAHALVSLAVSRGGRDNVSVVLVNW